MWKHEPTKPRKIGVPRSNLLASEQRDCEGKKMKLVVRLKSYVQAC